MKGIIFSTALLFSMLFAAAAKGSRSKVKKGKEPGVVRYNDALTIIKATIILTIAPAIIIFVYSVVNDPDTPIVLKALWKVAKNSGLKNLASIPAHDENVSSMETTKRLLQKEGN